MGILDEMKAGRMFNEANKHWKVRQMVILDETRQVQELLEVVRYCQLSIEASKKSGDAYVLLTNALVVADPHGRSGEDATALLTKYAAAAIHKWWTLPQNKYPITKAYDLGVRFYQQVIESVQQTEKCSQKEAAAKIVAYGAQYGDLVISPSSYERIKKDILNAVRG